MRTYTFNIAIRIRVVLILGLLFFLAVAAGVIAVLCDSYPAFLAFLALVWLFIWFKAKSAKNGSK